MIMCFISIRVCVKHWAHGRNILDGALATLADISANRACVYRQSADDDAEIGTRILMVVG